MPSLLQQLDVPICTTDHRYASAAALDAECARLEQTWLSPVELAELATRRNPNRCHDWLRSRLLLKQLIADVSSDQPALQQIEILQQATSRRLAATVCGCQRSWSLSLSHSDRGVLVAIAQDSSTSVGVDLADCEPLRSGFVQMWFTPAETARLESDSMPVAANMIWATKEAIFKACNRGEGFDPRQVEVLPYSIRYRGKPVDCHLQSWFVDGQVAVVVTVRNTPSLIKRELI